MLTIEKLEAYGADVETGLKRCRKESLYLKLAGKVTSNENFEALKESIANNDLDAAFEQAHGLKGIVTNLALTPLSDPICEVTELLRDRKDMDYGEYMEKIDEALENLKKIESE